MPSTIPLPLALPLKPIGHKNKGRPSKMSHIIRFEIETNSPYSDGETEELLNNFLDFMNEVDGDIVEDSEEIVIFDKDNAPAISDAQKQEIVKQWLDEAEFTAQITVDGIPVEANFITK